MRLGYVRIQMVMPPEHSSALTQATPRACDTVLGTAFQFYLELLGSFSTIYEGHTWRRACTECCPPGGWKGSALTRAWCAAPQESTPSFCDIPWFLLGDYLQSNRAIRRNLAALRSQLLRSRRGWLGPSFAGVLCTKHACRHHAGGRCSPSSLRNFRGVKAL